MVDHRWLRIGQRFGRHLRHLREEKDLTLRTAAELSEISSTRLWHLEHGLEPRVTELIRIAHVFQIEPADFLDWVGTTTKKSNRHR